MQIGFGLKKLWREKTKLTITLLGTAIGAMSLVVVSGVVSSAEEYLQTESRNLIGGDLSLAQNFPLEISDSPTLSSWQASEGYQLAEILETTSVVRRANQQEDDSTNPLQNSVTVSLKVVSNNYPLYGKVELEKDKYQHPTPEEVYVDSLIIEQLDLDLGQEIRIGNATFKVRGVIAKEPDQLSSLFDLGGRVLISSAGFQRSEIDRRGSRIAYKIGVKLPQDTNLDQKLAELTSEFEGTTAEITTFEEGPSDLGRTIDALKRFFLSIIVLVLLIAVIAIQSNVAYYISGEARVVAIFKCLGMKMHTIFQIFLTAILLITFLGGIIGEVLGNLLLFFLMPFLGNLIEIPLQYQFLPISIIYSIVYALFLGLIASASPLYKLWRIKPTLILRSASSGQLKIKEKLIELSLLIISLLGLALLYWFLTSSFKIALIAVGSVGGSFLLVYLITLAFLKLFKSLKKLNFNFYLEAVISFIVKPRSLSKITITALAFAFSTIFIAQFLRTNIITGLSIDLESEAPDMVVLDLQPEEVERFRQIVDQEIETYPVIRARIFSIDGVEIAQEEPLRDEEITRSFNLTYRSELIAGETLVAGEMASEESEEQVVSVSRAEAERFGIELGSEIIFDIQGRQIPLEVNSIRQLELTEFQPFFYFVTPPKVLERSPQTTFSFLTLRADQDIDEIQDRLASEFTGVSILRVKEALEKVQILTNSIAYIIIYISQLTAILGLIMLTGLLVASSEERKNDFMLMKVLGSRPSQLVYLYALELIFYVLIAFMLAYFLAALSAFLIGKYVFEFSTFVWDFAPFIVLAITLVLVLIIGALIMRTVFKEKPMQFLRNSN